MSSKSRLKPVGSLFKNVLWFCVGFIPVLLFLLTVFTAWVLFGIVARVNNVIARIFRKDLKFAGPLNHLMSVDDMDTAPSLNICVCITATGKIDVETLRSSMKNKVMEMKLRNNQREFEQLEEYPTYFGGLLYWKKEKNFCIDEHIRYYDYQDLDPKKPFTDLQVAETFTTMQNRAWEYGKSPWEMLVVNNYETDEDFGVGEKKPELSLILLRIHHCMADGYSILKVLVSNFQGSENLIAYPSFPKRRGVVKFLTACIIPFKFVIDFGKLVTIRAPVDQCAWSREEALKNRKYKTMISKGIQVDKIKFIKKRFACSFQAVMNALLAGVIQRMMLDAGQKVPKKFSMFMPVPLPGHPGGMTFWCSAVFMKLHVGAVDIRSRLLKSAKEFRGVTKTVLPVYMLPLVEVFYNTPRILLNLCNGGSGISIAVSHMPGPAQSGNMEKHQNIGTYFSIGTWRGNMGAAITSLSTRGKVIFVFNMRASIYPGTLEAITTKINTFLEEELEAMWQVAMEEDQFEIIKSDKITEV